MAKRWKALHRRRARTFGISKKPRRTCGFDHKWADGYYGTTCRKCHLFYAYGSAPWDDGGEYPDDCDDDGDCFHCGGDGYVDGYEDDPLWFEPGEMERCASCNGSGLRKDMTIW